jgi:hypothetical protein
MEDIASAIASGFPSTARSQARRVLLTSVLPWDLRAMSSFAEPRRLVETAYASLVELLGAIAPEERLPELEAQSRRRRSQQALDGAVGVAVARWAADSPSVVLPAPWRAAAAPYRDLDDRGFVAEVKRQLVVIDDLELNGCRRARRLMRPYVVEARFALRVASSRVYTAAIGPLLVFLRDMGVAARDVTLEMRAPRTDRMERLQRVVAVPPVRSKAR